MPPFWITTSWDDGHILDLKIAQLLDKYKLTGTFYIAKDYLPERMSEAEILDLSKRHEIGAHTLTHPILTDIDPVRLKHEVVGSRAWLQSITGHPITAFCYPKGKYNAAVKACVRDAGFRVGRTVAKYYLDRAVDPLELPTTLQIYPFPLWPVRTLSAKFQPLQAIVPYLGQLHISPLALRSWPTLALALLERVTTRGGVWHLWGHSWEIEHYQMWDVLDQILAAAGTYTQGHSVKGQSVTNSQLLS